MAAECSKFEPQQGEIFLLATSSRQVLEADPVSYPIDTGRLFSRM
jgi:hypothetical protein